MLNILDINAKPCIQSLTPSLQLYWALRSSARRDAFTKLQEFVFAFSQLCCCCLPLFCCCCCCRLALTEARCHSELVLLLSFSPSRKSTFSTISLCVLLLLLTSSCHFQTILRLCDCFCYCHVMGLFWLRGLRGCQSGRIWDRSHFWQSAINDVVNLK